MKQPLAYQSKSSVVACELDGGSVLLDLDTSRYFGLNAVGLFVWEQMSTAPTLDQICEAVGLKFEVAEDVCRRDVEQLLEQLIERRLIQHEAITSV